MDAGNIEDALGYDGDITKDKLSSCVFDPAPQCYQVGNALGKQDFNVRKIHYYIEVALFAGLFCNIRQSCRVLGSGGRTTKTILSDNVLIAIGSFF